MRDKANDILVTTGMHDILKPIFSPIKIMKEKYINTVWRVTKEQQKFIKRSAKRSRISEAEVVRHMIQSLINHENTK